MRVYIPSTGRAGFFSQRQMTSTYVREATFVVPPDEVKRYERVLQQMKGDFTVLSCPEKGIAAVRRWIGGIAKDRKEKTFLMCDDDLNFCVRKSIHGFHLRPATPDDIAKMLMWTEAMLDAYAHVSVSPRQANNVVESGGPETAFKTNKRTLRYLAYQTDKFLAMEHGRVPVMEDFDVNLQLLRAGFPNVVSYYWAQDQRETGTAGGCSSYRTLEAHNAAARRIVELHEPFAKLRVKENKSSLTEAAKKLATRMEVTIQWEKAFQSSHGEKR